MYDRNNTERIEDAVILFRRAATEADPVSGIAAIEWHKFDWKYVADWMDIQLKKCSESEHTHECLKCGHSYTPTQDQSEDCPKCNYNGRN